MSAIKPETRRTLLAIPAWAIPLTLLVTQLHFAIRADWIHELGPQGLLSSATLWKHHLDHIFWVIAIACGLNGAFFLKKQSSLLSHIVWIFAWLLCLAILQVIPLPARMDSDILPLILGLGLGVLIQILYFTSPRPSLALLAATPALVALIPPFLAAHLTGIITSALLLIAFWLKRRHVEKAAHELGGDRPKRFYQRRTLLVGCVAVVISGLLSVPRTAASVAFFKDRINEMDGYIHGPHPETVRDEILKLAEFESVFVTTIEPAHFETHAPPAYWGFRMQYWYTNAFPNNEVEGLTLQNPYGWPHKFALYGPSSNEVFVAGFIEKYDRPSADWDLPEVKALVAYHQGMILKWENHAFRPEYDSFRTNLYLAERGNAISNWVKQLIRVETLLEKKVDPPE